jgi:hypothetical protein
MTLTARDVDLRLVALENGIRRLEEGQFQIRQEMLTKENFSKFQWMS